MGVFRNAGGPTSGRGSKEPMAAVAAGALAVTAAYLDAKYDISEDLRLLKIVAGGRKMLDLHRFEASLDLTFSRAVKRVQEGRVNFFYTLEEVVHRVPVDHIWLLYRSRAWTYRQGMEQVYKAANWFLSIGLKKGDYVALDFMNKPYFIFMWMALFAIGMKPAMINFNLASSPLLHCIKISEAKLLIVDSEIEERVSTVADDLKKLGIRVISFQDEDCSKTLFGDEVICESDLERFPTTRPDDSYRSPETLEGTSMFMYTSGTTGFPKAAT